MLKSLNKDNKQLNQTANIQGFWQSDGFEPETEDAFFRKYISQISRSVSILYMNDRIQLGKTPLAVGLGGTATLGTYDPNIPAAFPLIAYAPPLHPKNMGDPAFKKRHQLKYPYIAGAMANGISSTKMVVEMGKAGMLGIFGAGGLDLDTIEKAIDEVQSQLGDAAYGFNLIHSPHDPTLEFKTVELYLKKKVRLISASAFMDLTLPLIYYRVKGIYKDEIDEIICPNRVIAKISRVEVARRFLAPPPAKSIQKLLESNLITPEEAELSQYIPMAEDLTAEADSGGHTDNRPAITLLPTMMALKDESQAKYNYTTRLSVGLAGGIATPDSAAAAFSMGAAFILTGTINQACVEADTSAPVKKILGQARQSDVMMAPAADMFEMGVKVQILKRGTMFGMRASKLFDVYSKHQTYYDIPEIHRNKIERDILKSSFEEEWQKTAQYFEKYDPKQIEIAENDSKHKMALVFRSYLGQSSSWAKTGNPTRQLDYQIWCGPSIGSFNEWASGSFLSVPENREVVIIAFNLLAGAAVVTRGAWLRSQGADLPVHADRFFPMRQDQLHQLLM